MSDADLLSQDEIDALLSGVDNGDLESDIEDAADDGKTILYDFSSQDRIIRGRMPTLEMINERFARSLRDSLFNMIRRSPVISIEGIQLSKFGDYKPTLLMPSNLNIVHMRPLKGSGLIVCNPKLVFALVDCFFGGEGRPSNKVEGREFTVTEMRIVSRLLEIVLADAQKAWEPVLPVTFEHVGTEVNPQFASIVAPSEVVVVSTFHIDLEAGSGDLQIVLPYLMLEPIRELLAAGIQSDAVEKDDRWSQTLHEDLKSAEVALSATLAHTGVSLGQVMKFKAGDIVPIELPQTVVARVEDVPVFRGVYGASRGRAALKVVEPIRHGELAPQTLSLGVRK